MTQPPPEPPDSAGGSTPPEGAPPPPPPASSSPPPPPPASSSPPPPPPPPPSPPPPPGDSGAGGYGAPPPGQPGGYGAAPASGQLSPSDERMWAMLAHIGAIVIGFIAPLVVMLVQGDKSPFTRKQAVESLNFQISLLIVGIPLTIITCGIGAVIFLVGIVFEIIGGIKANNGEDYRYPVSIRLVK